MRFLRNVVLMMLVNVGIIITLSIVLQVTGLNRYLAQSGTGYAGLAIFCLFWGMGGAFISLLLSKTIVKWSMRVKVVKWGEGDPTVQKLHRALQKIATTAQMKKIPEFGIYESDEMNAFATGPSESRALVAVSTGLIQRMSDEEMEGVLAHEVAHIKNGDMITMTLLQGIVNALVMFIARIIASIVASNLSREDGQRYWIRFGVMIACEMVLGLFGVMLTSWFSRKREFRADAGGARFAGATKMLGALEALQRRFEPLDNRAPQLAAFKISSGRKGGFMALVATHPPIAERISALKAASLSR